MLQRLRHNDVQGGVEALIFFGALRAPPKRGSLAPRTERGARHFECQTVSGVYPAQIEKDTLRARRGREILRVESALPRKKVPYELQCKWPELNG